MEVTELVREHGLEFTVRQPCEQRVVEDHAFAAPDASEVRIRLRRALAAVHHKQTLRRKTAALHQAADTLLKRLILQGFEFIEQRRDEHRIEHQQQQVERHPEDPCPQPPETSGDAHQPQHHGNQRQTDHRAEDQVLDEIT